MKPTTAPHAPVVAKRQMGAHLLYNGKNWSDRFMCPTCGAARRANLNFLGRRQFVCNGVNLTLVKKGA